MNYFLQFAYAKGDFYVTFSPKALPENSSKATENNVKMFVVGRESDGR